MKVFLTIWILAVLIQEVVPSALVRLQRQAEKNLSLVHTEYEAKYEQKGRHGNESFSSVSGKQEIVHDNCAENWNSFAEKCASLIKDLVASLANAVSSKPGDATNLQLHIKNTFRHFDNTQNCTCFNHTGKSFSDLNLSPLFKNITINTVEPSANIDSIKGSEANYKECGVRSQHCSGDDDADTNENENLMPQSNGVRRVGNRCDRNQLKRISQSLDESSNENKRKPHVENNAKSEIFDEKLTEGQKGQNRGLVNAEDLDMNPENSEGSSDQSTNYSRRQINHPENLKKSRKLSENSSDADYNPLPDDLKHSSSNPKRPQGVPYPFSVTVPPNTQSSKSYKSPVAALNPSSESKPSLESDFKTLPSPIPVTNSNKNIRQSYEPESNIVTLNPSPVYKHSHIGSSSSTPSGIVTPGRNLPILSPEDILPTATNGQPLVEGQSTVKSSVHEPSSIGSSSSTPSGIVMPGRNLPILSPEDILPTATNGQPLVEGQSTVKSSVHEPSSIGSNSSSPSGIVMPGRNLPILSPEDILPTATNGQPLIEGQSTVKSSVHEPSSIGSSSSTPSGIVMPGRNLPILSPEDILPTATNGQPLIEGQSTVKSSVHEPSLIGSSSSTPSGIVTPGRNLPILSPEDILPTATNGQPLIEEQSTVKSSVHEPSSIGSSSSTPSGIVTPGRNLPILSPEDILPTATNGQPLIEEQSTAEYHRNHTLFNTKPILGANEVVSQQPGFSTPMEQQLRDKLKQQNVSNLGISIYPTPAPLELTLSQKSDPEILNSVMGKPQYSQESRREEKFTTPLPLNLIKTGAVIPAISQQLNPQTSMVAEGTEVHELQGKHFTVTEIPTEFNTPKTSITEDQQRQPKTVIVGGTLQNINTPIATPEIAVTTPVIIYPVTSLPISLQSQEQTREESSHPVLINTSLSDGNEKPEEQKVFFTTPIPLTKPIQVEPLTTEQQNGQTISSVQPPAITDSFLTSDSHSKHELPIKYSPVKESDNVQDPQVILQPNEISAQLSQPNFDHHPQDSTDSNSGFSSTTLETIPGIPSLKPAQPGVLIHNTEAQPHPEGEQNSLLLQPTTFQTTSEGPTPSQVNVPGLLTHTTSVPQDSDETMPIRPSTSPKTKSIYEHDDDDEEDCCSCESCTEEEITDPKQYKETACKNLEEARKELKAIFDKIKKKLKCGRKAPQTITSR